MLFVSVCAMFWRVCFQTLLLLSERYSCSQCFMYLKTSLLSPMVLMIKASLLFEVLD